MVDAISISTAVYIPKVDMVQNSPPVKKSEVKEIPPENDIQYGNKNTKPDQSELEKAAGQFNEKFNLSNREMKFSIHEKTGEVSVKIINKSTNEVIMEVPSTELLDLKAKIDEMVGILIDKKV